MFFMHRASELGISIHAPAKGATAELEIIFAWLMISIHAPAKGATPQQLNNIYKKKISIHAPAKGATDFRVPSSGMEQKFQSTLPRRERRSPPKMLSHTFSYFNPRSREGSDFVCPFVHSSYLLISIHAPAKGATKTVELRFYNFIFQSTLPRRERLPRWSDNNAYNRFQSTLPRRERQAIESGYDIVLQFQSTLPRRERQQICTIFYYDIGISAQYYYIFLNKNNLMNSFKTNFNRFYYIFLVRISLHLHVKLLFAPHNTTLLT